MSITYWKNDSSLVAGTTSRNDGYSKSPFNSNNMAFYVGDNDEDVLNNRRKLATAINISLDHWVFPKITHSTNIHKVTKEDLGKGSLSEEGSLMNVDGIYTRLTDVALAVFHADCIPILFYDPTTHLIGALHAGWVGTLAKITSAFMQILIKNEHVNPKDLLIYIGPALSQSNFQVRKDVIEKVESQTPEFLPYLNKQSDDLAYFDAIGMNIHQLCALGINKNNITHLDQCTYDNTDLYFSYRKDHNTGRNISFIVQKPTSLL